MQKVNKIFEQRCNEISGISGIPTLRKLTRKSKFGFGTYKDLTMQKLLDLGKKFDLIAAYYKLTSITFVDDILEEIGITGEYLIKKPGADRDMYTKFIEDKHATRTQNRKKANISKREIEKRYGWGNREIPKRFLQAKNHGKYNIKPK